MFKYLDSDHSDKVRVYPQGIAIAGDETGAFVLFKDKKEKISFPIWCPVLPLGLVPVDSSANVKNPYELTVELLSHLDFQIKECVFDGFEHDVQFATLFMQESEDKQRQIPIKAYEAIALCGTKKDSVFYATQAFIQKARDVVVFEKENPTELLKKNSFLRSGQKYLM